jgi:hypothetical protein
VAKRKAQLLKLAFLIKANLDKRFWLDSFRTKSISLSAFCAINS